MQLYCLKCKKKTESVGAKKTKMGKRYVFKGSCKACGTKQFQFTSA
jgi:hypothetical protein